MLDSLVRVSRRVGGAADLLGREGRTATGCRLLYKSARDPSGPKPGHRELKAREGKQPLSQAFGPVPTVPAVNRGESAAGRRACTTGRVIADHGPPAAHHQA